MKKLKILIVENDAISKNLLTIYVKEISDEILSTATGEEAIEIFRKNMDIDLILLDIRLPRMSGYDVCKEIRRIKSDVIIISQTAQAMTGDRNRSISAGCDDYVSKPMTQAKLINTIKKYFNT